MTKPVFKIEYLDTPTTAHVAGRLRLTAQGETRIATILRSTNPTTTAELIGPIMWTPYPFNTNIEQHVKERDILKTWIALRRFYLYAHGIA